MTAADHLAAVRARVDRANAEMDRLTAAPGGPGQAWRWQVPADPDRDSDLILADSLADVPRLAAFAQAVLDLHHADGDGWCAECGYCAPCRTARLADEHLGGTR